jgi:hypothetical protein
VFPPLAIGSATAAGLENGADTANSMQGIKRYEQFELAALAPTAFGTVYNTAYDILVPTHYSKVKRIKVL